MVNTCARRIDRPARATEPAIHDSNPAVRRDYEQLVCSGLGARPCRSPDLGGADVGGDGRVMGGDAFRLDDQEIAARHAEHETLDRIVGLAPEQLADGIDAGAAVRARDPCRSRSNTRCTRVTSSRTSV